jgi:hypothetical protein
VADFRAKLWFCMISFIMYQGNLNTVSVTSSERERAAVYRSMSSSNQHFVSGNGQSTVLSGPQLL